MPIDVPGVTVVYPSELWSADKDHPLWKVRNRVAPTSTPSEDLGIFNGFTGTPPDNSDTAVHPGTQLDDDLGDNVVAVAREALTHFSPEHRQERSVIDHMQAYTDIIEVSFSSEFGIAVGFAAPRGHEAAPGYIAWPARDGPPDFSVGLQPSKIKVCIGPGQPIPQHATDTARYLLDNGIGMTGGYTQVFPHILGDHIADIPDRYAEARLLTAMNFALGMTFRLHARADAAEHGACIMMHESTTEVFGFLAAGPLVSFYIMTRVNDQTYAARLWQGSIDDPPNLARFLGLLARANAGIDERARLVSNWLYCLRHEPRTSVEVGEVDRSLSDRAVQSEDGWENNREAGPSDGAAEPTISRSPLLSPTEVNPSSVRAHTSSEIDEIDSTSSHSPKPDPSPGPVVRTNARAASTSPAVEARGEPSSQKRARDDRDEDDNDDAEHAARRRKFHNASPADAATSSPGFAPSSPTPRHTTQTRHQPLEDNTEVSHKERENGCERDPADRYPQPQATNTSSRQRSSSSAYDPIPHPINNLPPDRRFPLESSAPRGSSMTQRLSLDRGIRQSPPPPLNDLPPTALNAPLNERLLDPPRLPVVESEPSVPTTVDPPEDHFSYEGLPSSPPYRAVRYSPPPTPWWQPPSPGGTQPRSPVNLAPLSSVRASAQDAGYTLLRSSPPEMDVSDMVHPEDLNAYSERMPMRQPPEYTSPHVQAPEDASRDSAATEGLNTHRAGTGVNWLTDIGPANRVRRQNAPPVYHPYAFRPNPQAANDRLLRPRPLPRLPSPPPHRSPVHGLGGHTNWGYRPSAFPTTNALGMSGANADAGPSTRPATMGYLGDPYAGGAPFDSDPGAGPSGSRYTSDPPAGGSQSSRPLMGLGITGIPLGPVAPYQQDDDRDIYSRSRGDGALHRQLPSQRREAAWEEGLGNPDRPSSPVAPMHDRRPGLSIDTGRNNGDGWASTSKDDRKRRAVEIDDRHETDFYGYKLRRLSPDVGPSSARRLAIPHTADLSAAQTMLLLGDENIRPPRPHNPVLGRPEPADPVGGYGHEGRTVDSSRGRPGEPALVRHDASSLVSRDARAEGSRFPFSFAAPLRGRSARPDEAADSTVGRTRGEGTLNDEGRRPAPETQVEGERQYEPSIGERVFAALRLRPPAPRNRGRPATALTPAHVPDERGRARERTGVQRTLPPPTTPPGQMSATPAGPPGGPSRPVHPLPGYYGLTPTAPPAARQPAANDGPSTNAEAGPSTQAEAGPSTQPQTQRDRRRNPLRKAVKDVKAKMQRR